MTARRRKDAKFEATNIGYQLMLKKFMIFQREYPRKMIEKVRGVEAGSVFSTYKVISGLGIHGHLFVSPFKIVSFHLRK